MSNLPSKILLKMNSSIHNFFALLENAAHPAAGKMTVEKRKKRSSSSMAFPKATPDSLNIRDMYKNPNGIRRNPAP